MIELHTAAAARHAGPRTIPRIDTTSPPGPYSLPRAGALTEPEIFDALKSGANLEEVPILLLRPPQGIDPAARARSVLQWLAFASARPGEMKPDPNDIRQLSMEAIDNDPGSSVLAMYHFSFAFKVRIRPFDYEIAAYWLERATRDGAAPSEMLAAAQCVYTAEPRAALAILERARALAPDSREIAEWSEYVGSVAADRVRVLRSVSEATRQLRPVRESLLELGDTNDPSLPARLRAAHSAARLLELADRYQQMARVAFDAHDFDACWLGANIALQLLDSFTPDAIRARLLSESASYCGRAKLATGNAAEAGKWLLKAGEYLASADWPNTETVYMLAAELIDAHESRAVAEFLLRYRPILARAKERMSGRHLSPVAEEPLSLWLFLLSRNLPPTIR